MTRRASILLAATAVGFILLMADGGAAENRLGRPDRLLVFDAPALDASALAAETLRGLGGPLGSPGVQPADFNVILWDEVKPGRPSPLPPRPSSAGQGSSTVNGISR